MPYRARLDVEGKTAIKRREAVAAIRDNEGGENAVWGAAANHQGGLFRVGNRLHGRHPRPLGSVEERGMCVCRQELISPVHVRQRVRPASKGRCSITARRMRCLGLFQPALRPSYRRRHERQVRSAPLKWTPSSSSEDVSATKDECSRSFEDVVVFVVVVVVVVQETSLVRKRV